MRDKFFKAFFIAIRKGNVPAVRASLLEGADPNWRDENELTALIWSARKGHFEVFSELVRARADLNLADRMGRTFLHHAVLFRRYDFLRRAIKLPGVPLHATESWGCTALDLAYADRNQLSANLLEAAGVKACKYKERPNLRSGGI